MFLNSSFAPCTHSLPFSPLSPISPALRKPPWLLPLPQPPPTRPRELDKRSPSRPLVRERVRAQACHPYRLPDLPARGTKPSHSDQGSVLWVRPEGMIRFMVTGDELGVLMEPLPCAVTRSVRKNSTGPVSPTRRLAPSLDLMSLTDDGLTVLVCTLR